MIVLLIVASVFVGSVGLICLGVYLTRHGEW